VTKVDLFLRGSFAATYWGHGTDRALAAGLLGFAPDDPRIPQALEISVRDGLEIRFFAEEVDGAHPNSVRFTFRNEEGLSLEVIGASIGGGAVEILSIDGFRLSVSGELPCLVTFHRDQPGVVAAVAGELSRLGVNIATMHLHRQGRGEVAAMVIEIDGSLDDSVPQRILDVHTALERVLLLPRAGGDA
jgi:L-serine dehydratase